MRVPIGATRRDRLRRLVLSTCCMLLCCLASLRAQSLDELNIELHGYATQAFLYSNHNSWNTTDSENGSAAWNEAVVNLTSEPEPKLRIGVQARYELLADYSNGISLDWALADYKFNDAIGIRVGKVKSPVGLLNEVQDVDPVELWALLPQSVYPIASRNSTLTHYGAVVYGRLRLSRAGKLEYRGFGGEREIGAGDGYFAPYRDAGFSVPNGLTGPTGGGMLRWLTPRKGLMLGSSGLLETLGGEAGLGPLNGKVTLSKARQICLFGQYEHGRWMLAAEAARLYAAGAIDLTGVGPNPVRTDRRSFYVAGSAHLTNKLNAGLYYSNFIDVQASLGPYRFQKDWALSSRYDFTSLLYAKLEQHWFDGAGVGFDASDNPNIHGSSRLSILKLGVNF